MPFCHEAGDRARAVRAYHVCAPSSGSRPSWLRACRRRADARSGAAAAAIRGDRSGGGWLVLGRMAPPPDPLAETTALRTTRGGGADFDTKRLAAVLEDAGCVSVRVLPRQGPAPLEYVIGQRPGG
jgi:hypothetical protein